MPLAPEIGILFGDAVVASIHWGQDASVLDRSCQSHCCVAKTIFLVVQ